MWKPREGSKPVEPIMSEFWKPEVAGEVLMGKLIRIKPTRFEKDNADFEPAIIVGAGNVPPQVYGSMSVSINTWLAKLIRSQQVGKYIAIGYKGTETTPNGEMRTFAVYEISEQEYREIALQGSKAVPRSAVEDESHDDLPF